MRGQIKSITKAIKGDAYVVTIETDTLPVDLEGKLLDIDMKVHREKRSRDANALLWACIGEITKALQKEERYEKTDKWEVYLKLLKRYGKFTYIVVKPEAVDAVKKQWRETEVVGEIDIHGTKGIQMLCYYGSSTYDTAEMSALLDGTVSELEEMGLQRPASAEMKRAMEEWERKYGNSNEKICNTAKTESTEV